MSCSANRSASFTLRGRWWLHSTECLLSAMLTDALKTSLWWVTVRTQTATTILKHYVSMYGIMDTGGIIIAFKSQCNQRPCLSMEKSTRSSIIIVPSALWSLFCVGQIQMCHDTTVIIVATATSKWMWPSTRNRRLQHGNIFKQEKRNSYYNGK